MPEKDAGGGKPEKGGAGAVVPRNSDYTPNQCKMLTGLGGRRRWQPNCIS